ncbi:hypothetical protein HYV49_05125 [Candidatus Pacearchaeota archaeon]|nr:hypothetical protein [Candidatus Pacearchaeota archaeon]
MNFENTKLIGHKFCLDGSTTAILFLYFGGKKENIIFTNPDHGAVDAAVKEACNNFDGELLIVDVSVSMECAKFLDKRKGVLLLDHHKTAIPLSKYSFCHIEKENKRCGSRMLFEYFADFWEGKEWFNSTKQNLDLLTKYVDGYDRWTREYSESNDLCALMNFMGQEMFINRFFAISSPILTEHEQYALKIIQKRNEETIKKELEKAVIINRTIDGKSYRIVFGTGDELRSEIGNSFIEKLDADLAVIVNASKVSFRSSEKSGFDCAKLALRNKGGGHRLSGGSNVRNIIGESFIELIDRNLKYE